MVEDLKIYKNNPYPWGIYYLIVEIRTRHLTLLEDKKWKELKKK